MSEISAITRDVGEVRSPTGEKEFCMSRDANIAAQEHLSNSLNAGDIDAAVESFDENVVDHHPAPRSGPRPRWLHVLLPGAGLGVSRRSYRAGAHGCRRRPCRSRVRLDRHSQGRDFQGVAPTGKRIEARGMQIGRFEKRKIVERWGSTDELGIMRQLGTVPQPA